MASPKDKNAVRKEPPTMARVVEILNGSFERKRNPAVARLCGTIIDFSEEMKSMTMEFELGESYCKDDTNTAVLEAFAGACLDLDLQAVIAQLVVSYFRLTVIPSSIEYKNIYLQPCPPNIKLHGKAWIITSTQRFCFIEAELKRGGTNEVYARTSSIIHMQHKL